MHLSPSLPQPVKFQAETCTDIPAKQYIFHSYNIYFQCCVLWWKSFHMPMQKQRQKGFRVSNFALLLVGFKRHHGSEGVNTLISSTYWREGWPSWTEHILRGLVLLKEQFLCSSAVRLKLPGFTLLLFWSLLLVKERRREREAGWPCIKHVLRSLVPSIKGRPFFCSSIA